MLTDPTGAAAPARRAAVWLTRPGVLVATGVVLAVAGFQLWVDPSNPPGFHRDEASLAYNAHTISRTLRDEHGALLPLYIESFGDYKSSVFVYALAGVFRITGPSAQVARGVAAVAVLAAILLLALLALRRTGEGRVALAVVVLGGLTPWLFELGRVAVEVTLEPAVLVLLLLALDSAWRRGRWNVGNAVLVGVLLGLVAYVYAAGRLLAPLLAVALVLLAGRGRLRWLVAVWTTFALCMTPLAVYALRHPGALSARFHQTTFVTDGMSVGEIVRTFLGNYLRDLSLWTYVTGGDPKPHIHVAGASMLLATVVVLAVAGVALGLRRERSDHWFRFVLAALFLVPVPAALTQDRFNGYRLALLPVLLLVLALPALAALLRAYGHSRGARATAAVLALATLLQFGHFLSVHLEKGGSSRLILYEAGVPALLDRAFPGGAAVYMDFDEPRAHAHARWYAATHGIQQERVVVLSDGGVPPDGSIVFGRAQACDFECAEFARWDTYWLARARVPG